MILLNWTKRINRQNLGKWWNGRPKRRPLVRGFLLLLLCATTVRAQSESKEPASVSLPSETSLFRQLSAPARKAPGWQRYVRDFRQGHNLSVVLGLSRGVWTVGRLGTVFGSRFESRSVLTRVEYGFHIPVHRQYGYVLGSSFGYQQAVDDGMDVAVPGASIHYPSFMVGAVVNITPGIRASVGLDYFLERHERIQERDGISGREDGVPDDPKIGITMTSLDYRLSVDVFFDIKLGLRIGLHKKSKSFERPKSPQGKAVNGEMSNEGNWFGLGVIYHLL